MDWDGNCIFNQKGQFTGFKNPNNPNNAIGRPIPRTKEVMAMARNADIELNELLKPIENKQFAVLFKRLTLLCGTQKLTETEYKVFFSSYYESLKSYPYEVVRKVFKNYIEQEEDNNYLPKIGFLKRKMQDELKPILQAKYRNDLILGNIKQDNKVNELTKLLVGVKSF